MSEFRWREHWTGISYLEIGDQIYHLPDNIKMVYAGVFCVCAKCNRADLADVFELTEDQMHLIFVDPDQDTIICQTFYDEFIVYHPGEELAHCDTIDEAIQKLEDYKWAK